MDQSRCAVGALPRALPSRPAHRENSALISAARRATPNRPSDREKTTLAPWSSGTDRARIVLNVWEETGKTARLRPDEPEAAGIKLEHGAPRGAGPGGGGEPEGSGVAIDLLKGTDAVVFMVHPAKRWTMEFVERELRKLNPRESPALLCCILYNFMDELTAAGGRAAVDVGEAIDLAGEFNVEGKPERVVVIQTSMADCYGLSRLNSFLQVVYLR